MASRSQRVVASVMALIAGLVLVWAVWAASGRAGSGAGDTPLAPARAVAVGRDQGHGNMLAVQPWLTPADYASAAALQRKLGFYLAQAQAQHWLGDATIAVFPEYTGTWLVAAGEKESVLSAHAVDAAMTTVALTHLPQFAYYLATSPAVTDPAKWALFSVKAERMAEDYQTVFSQLARQYGIRIVAGSIVLPEPRLVDGRLQVRPGGSMANVSALFGPDGKIVGPLITKAFLIEEEQAFSAAGRPQDIPVFDTPAGRLGVLICADSWFSAAYANLQKNGAQLIAVPSFSAGDGIWQSSWAGYNGAPNERDVSPNDIGHLTEGQAWLKYAMAARAPSFGVRQGVNVFLRGALWDLGTDGTTVALQNGQTVVGELVPQAVLTSLWLP